MAPTSKLVGFLLRRQDLYPKAQRSQSPQTLGFGSTRSYRIERNGREKQVAYAIHPTCKQWAFSLSLV